MIQSGINTPLGLLSTTPTLGLMSESSHSHLWIIDVKATSLLMFHCVLNIVREELKYQELSGDRAGSGTAQLLLQAKLPGLFEAHRGFQPDLVHLERASLLG